MPGKKSELNKNKLTEREIEIATMIADGLSNPMIAKKLIISEQTVNTHRKNIFKKLEVHKTAELIKKLYDINAQTGKKVRKKKKNKYTMFVVLTGITI